MTSYIPLLFKGALIPVKVGGNNAGGEPKVTKDQEATLRRAMLAGDKEGIKKAKDVIDIIVDDIRNAYMVWIRKEFSSAVPLSTKEVTFVIAGEHVNVPLRSVTRYGKPPEKHTKAASAKAAWFGVDAMLKPFKHVKKIKILAALQEGIALDAKQVR